MNAWQDNKFAGDRVALEKQVTLPTCPSNQIKVYAKGSIYGFKY